MQIFFQRLLKNSKNRREQSLWQPLEVLSVKQPVAPSIGSWARSHKYIGEAVSPGHSP